MKTEDLIIYICKKYPIPDELSKARLTKMVYLIDWESCKNTGHQFTNINWYFHNFGPYVDDVIDSAKKCKSLHVDVTQNFYGERKEVVSANKEALLPDIEKKYIEIIDSVIETTKKLYWNDFIKLVYSTPPIAGSNKHTQLNLEHFAKITKR